MAEVQQEIVTGFARMIAAGFGAELESEESMPYCPTILQAVAESGKDLH